MTARAIVVGSSPIFREGVRVTLQGGGYEVLGSFSFVAEIETGDEVPDFAVILVDDPMLVVAVEDTGTRAGGAEEDLIAVVVGGLRRRFPNIKIVAHSPVPEEPWADATVALTAAPEQLVDQVRRLFEQ